MRRWWSLVVSVLLVLGVAGPADALNKTSVTWTPKTSGPSLIWDATAFAASTGELVQFGGTTGYATPTTTRLFSPSTGVWTTLSAPKRGWPQARTLARMVWDPVHARVVMFGGRTDSGTPLQDTWAFDPRTRTWTQYAINCRSMTCPPARLAHGMVWSSVMQRIVVFGGTPDGLGGTQFNDAWSFDGTAWTRLATTNAPAGRFLFGMAEDASTGRLVVFGGAMGNSDVVTDTATYVLDLTTRAWQRLATSTVPIPRVEMGMAWLGSVGAVVIATGGDGTSCMSWSNTVWAFDAAVGNWRQLSTSGATPTPRNEASLTANPLDGSAVLIGGTGDNKFPLTLVDRAWVLR